MKAASFVSASPFENELLASLSPEIQNRLFPFLEPSPLPQGMVLYESGKAMSHAYFPTNAIVSLLYIMLDGASADITIVGKEGIVGIAVLMGGNTTPGRAVVQSAGNSFRLPVQALKNEFNRHGELLFLMLHYTQVLITQMAHTAVCNRYHTVEQQLCRSILMSLDRLPDQDLYMTQELLANMMGVRRESVTEAAGKLQNQGIIKYSRGHITVLDRQALEEQCCGCYQILKMESKRLLSIGPVQKEYKSSHVLSPGRNRPSASHG